MSFATDIYNVMTGDASLNEYTANNIQYTNLSDNWLGERLEDDSVETNNTWIVYEFNREEQTNCISSKNLFTNYRLSIVFIQRYTNTLMDIVTDRLINYLNNLSSGNIIDIAFLNDDLTFNQQLNVYTNTLEFECTYT